MTFSTARPFSFRLLLVIAAAMGGTLAACSDDDADIANQSGNSQSSQDQVQIADDAPDPATIQSGDLDLIPEWRESGVPRFRGGEVLEFEPHASEIPNAGTIVLDGNGATPEEVIAFYRGALRVLGWEERRVRAHELTARSEHASLLVVVTTDEETTMIMLMLTD